MAEYASLDLANRRGHRRYPAWIEVSLSHPAANTIAPATIVDLSLGGALVQTHPGLQPADVVSLTVSSALGPFSLEGMVLRVESSWTGDLLHIEFDDQEPATKLILCRMLDDLERDFRRHQLGIAGARL